MDRPSPFRLVPSRVSEQTIGALEQLLAGAKRGDLIGFAFVAMWSDRTYTYDTAGEARRSPTFTLGMLDVLHEHVYGLVTRESNLS